jgi:hypothetical protein
MYPASRFITVITATIFSACASTGTSIIYGDDYDKANDQTTVTIFPYGNVKVPGKWTKTSYNNVSGQYFFIGPDSVRIAIALQPWDKYEFSHGNPEVTPENFVRKFYEWDANYLKTKINGQVKVLVENREKNYIVWNLQGQRTNEYFLFGLKGKSAYNLYVTTSNWDESRKVGFLERLFAE